MIFAQYANPRLKLHSREQILSLESLGNIFSDDNLVQSNRVCEKLDGHKMDMDQGFPDHNFLIVDKRQEFKEILSHFKHFMSFLQVEALEGFHAQIY